MSNNLFSTTYNNFNDMPYMNGGEDVSNSYFTDLENLKAHIKTPNNYLDSSGVQTALEKYYENDYQGLQLDELEKYVANSFVENEKLSQSEFKNKLNYAIKTENLHKNIENNKLYNPALQKMVDEDISLDTIDIENITQSLHNKTRNLEIQRYYEAKNQQQIGVLKIAVILFIVLLYMFFLFLVSFIAQGKISDLVCQIFDIKFGFLGTALTKIAEVSYQRLFIIPSIIENKCL